MASSPALEPDWDGLRAISRRIDELEDAGQWDRPAWEKALVDAEAAVNGHGEFLEFLIVRAPAPSPSADG